jgi:hypothetical protein
MKMVDNRFALLNVSTGDRILHPAYS